jgi:hypothetical protein
LEGSFTMGEWFYVKNDLKAREDIKEIIQRPIWSRFGLRRPKVEIDGNVEACQRAFSFMCAFIGTRDLIQEHISFRVCPLVESWDMPKETTADSSEGGLVRLKYTFIFRQKFDEPNDDWLKCIEATSDELLGAYSKAEDNALSVAFGGRGKKRLNRVFDAIGFVYPDYRYPLQGQEKKRKIAASVTPAEPKSKKVKVLTHQSHYIEPTVVPEFGVGSSSAAEAKQTVLIMQSAEDPTVVPKVPIVEPTLSKDDKAEEPQSEETMKMPEILSPSTEAKLLKAQKASAATPKRRRMANVLDAVLETMKALSPAPSKKIAKAQTEVITRQVEVETGQAGATTGQAKAKTGQAEAKTGPLMPSETKVVMSEVQADQQTSDTILTTGQYMAERAKSPASKAQAEAADYIYRHASGKKLSEDEIAEARHYAQKLKYPKGALVFNGSNEDDFMYCIPYNKEISVCWEIAKSMGFPKLEMAFQFLSKDDLADSLAYNSIKV